MARLLPALLLLLAACEVDPPLVPGQESLGVYDFVARVPRETLALEAEGRVPEGGELDCLLLLQDESGEELRGRLPRGPDGGFPTEAPAHLLPLHELLFQASFSRQPDAGQAWYTLRGRSHDAGFDGQVLRVVSQAPRQLERCGSECSLVLEERLTLALLSSSQSDALGGRCPPEPLDGGVPAPDGEGILAPGSTPTGFDAVRACGELEDRVLPGEGCTCSACSVRYVVTGVRR